MFENSEVFKATSGKITAYVIFANTDDIHGDIIFANTDISKAKLNKNVCEKRDYSPLIYNAIQQELIENLKAEKTERIALPNSFNGFSLPKFPSSLKILSIGNSFTDQPLSRMPLWVNSLGISNVTYGKVSRAGGSLQQHFEALYDEGNIQSHYFLVSEYKDGEQSGFDYVNAKTSDKEKVNCCISDAFAFTDWDIITFHQASPLSGKWDSIEPYLPKLIQAARQYCPNAGVKIGWQQTWAYAKGYSGLSNYENSQETMFNAIVECSKKVVQQFGVDLIIPNGIIMQTLRSLDNSVWGENKQIIKGDEISTYVEGSSATGWTAADFCEDGLHPNDFAEYCFGASFTQMLIASCFNKTIRGANATLGYATGDLAKIARQIVLKSIGNRFEISEIDTTLHLE